MKKKKRSLYLTDKELEELHFACEDLNNYYNDQKCEHGESDQRDLQMKMLHSAWRKITEEREGRG